MRDGQPAVGPARRLHRRPAGDFYDIDEGRGVVIDDLVEDVREGRGFRVHDVRTGADCTQRVLLEVLTRALLPSREPHQGEWAQPAEPAPPETSTKSHLRLTSRTDPGLGA